MVGKLHQYPDYETYVAAQTEGNKRKLLTHRGVFEEAIEWMARLVILRNPSPRFGLCHGTRAGWEQRWFKKHLPHRCKVLGTEISETATQFPDTLHWDYHKIKEDWIDSVDFIYSNSYDHAMNPELAFGNWLKCLVPDTGIMLLEHSDGHLPKYVTSLDCFGIELPGLITMLERLGGHVTVTNDFPFEVPKYIPNLHILAVTR